MAIRCVTPTGSGSTGASWSAPAAWGSVTLTRGDVIYLADGSYAGKTLSTANNGTTTITIKKATVSDHGTDTGWNAGSMGAGQAAFTGALITTTSYWIIDGNRSTTPWDACAPGSFGFYRSVPSGGDGVDWQNAFTGNQLINFDITGPGFRSTTSETHAVLISHGGDPLNQNWLISKCRFQNMDTMLKLDNALNCIVDNCTFRYCSSGNLSSVHPDTIYAYPCDGVTVRHCFFGDVDSESIFFDYGESTNWYFYGNVMRQGTGSSSSGIELKQDFTWGLFHFWNNVFIGWSKPAIYIRGNVAAGSTIKNNIFWSTSCDPMNATVDYNGFLSASTSGTHAYTGAGDPFVNSGALNFRPNAASWPIGRGVSVGASPYNLDADGNTRGADGTWDLGAYEYTTGGTPPSGTITLSVR